MKNSYRILLGVASLAAVGVIIILAQRGKNETMRKRTQEVADEGYELAYDVLYPLRNKRFRD